MQNFPFVENLKASNDLYKDVPDFLFLDVSFPFLVVTDLLKDVSVVSILHDEATKRSVYITVTYQRELLESSMKASLYDTMFG